MSTVRPLLDDAYAPITLEVGFIELPQREVVAVYVEWQERIAHLAEDDFDSALSGLGVVSETFEGPEALPELPPLGPDERAVTVREIHGTLADGLEALLPLIEIGHDRVLFAGTDGGWTAYFDNGWRGTDAFPPMSYLAREHGCRALRVVAVAPGGGRYEASALEVYGPVQTDWLNVERAISAMNDGGRWRFSARGRPFPFEDVERYGARQIRDRFPHELLERYTHALGVHVFDDSFYMPDGTATLIEFTPRYDRGHSYTLAEARAEAAIPASSALPPTQWQGVALIRRLLRRGG